MATASKQIEAVKTNQVALKTTQADAVKTNLAATKTTQAPVKVAESAAKTTRAPVQGSVAASASKLSAAMTAQAPVTPTQPDGTEEGEDEGEEGEEWDGYDSEITTKTDSMAMPTHYVPPQLKVQMTSLSLAGGGKTVGVRPKTMLKKSFGGKLGGKKRRGKGWRKMTDSNLMGASVNQGERESLDQGQGARSPKEGIDRQRSARRRKIAIFVLVAITVIAVVGVITIIVLHILGKPPPNATSQQPGASKQSMAPVPTATENTSNASFF